MSFYRQNAMKLNNNKQRNIRSHRNFPVYQNNYRVGVCTSPDDKRKALIYVDQVQTQQITLPNSSFKNFSPLNRENSQLLKKKQIIFMQNFISKPQNKDKNPSKTSNNVINYYEMNNKCRKIRNFDYKYNTSRKIENLILQQQIQSRKTSPTLRNHQYQNLANCQMILTAVGKKRSIDSIPSPPIHNPQFLRHQDQYVNVEMLKNDHLRPRTMQNTRRHNPLVIYPLSTKLRSKNLLDNPKMFKNIIIKKYKNLQKDGLDLFLNKKINEKLI